MHIRLRLDHPRRGWHLALFRALSARPGTAVSVEGSTAEPEARPNGRRLAALERLLRRRPGGLSAPLLAAAFDASCAAPDAPVDLAIDLRGGADLAGPRLWRLLFDGSPGEAALFGAALGRRTPVAAVVDGGGSTVAVGRLGTENGGAVAAALEDLLAGAIALIGAALDGAAATALPVLPGEAEPARADAGRRDLSPGTLARRSGKLVAVAAARAGYDLCFDSPQWRVGWRRLDGPDLWDLRRHPAAGWRALPDDGERFYADPFPIAPTLCGGSRDGTRGGEVTLFVEDFEHRLGRGVISAVRFGPDGPVGAPEPVLDTGDHLSYPLVFEADGEIWMIPESCSVRRVDLYRARRFPGDWTHEATLVEGSTVSDATIHRVGATWWMFGTVREAGGCFSDELHLWTAPDFRGPWTPHPRNPVLIDVASARPAGRMVERDGALLRPVQDCRDGYGAALGLARVTRLDGGGFAQEVEAILCPGPAWPGRRLHTLNAAGGFEFIDGSGLPRWTRPARLMRRLRGLAGTGGRLAPAGPAPAGAVERSRAAP